MESILLLFAQHNITMTTASVILFIFSSVK